MCGLSSESAFLGHSWLPFVFPFGMFVGSILLLGVMGLLMIWLILHGSPPWLFPSRQAWQHNWREEDGFSTLGEERDVRGSEHRIRLPEPLKW
jgi:hypothetical protein